jgi:hypothetical protein
VSMPGSSEWFPPFTFPMTTILPYTSPRYVPPYFLVPDLPNGTEWDVQIVNLLMTQLSPPLSYLLPVALTTFRATYSHTLAANDRISFTNRIIFSIFTCVYFNPCFYEW